MAEKEPAIRGVGRRRISDVLNFKKVEQIIRECSGRSIAKSPVNDKGIRYNRNGMLLGRLNVVNVGLLLGAEEDEYRGGGLRVKSPCSTSIHCWGGSHLTHTQEGFASEKKIAVNTAQRAGEGCAPLLLRNGRKRAARKR